MFEAKIVCCNWCRGFLYSVCVVSTHDLWEKMTEAINNLSQEVNNAVNESLAGVQDYVNITLQVTNIFCTTWVSNMEDCYLFYSYLQASAIMCHTFRVLQSFPRHRYCWEKWEESVVTGFKYKHQFQQFNFWGFCYWVLRTTCLV